MKPVGPYTPLVKAGPWLVCSGQVGIADGAIVEGGLEPELRQAFANLRGLLEAEGATLDAVTKTTVFLVDMADYGLWIMLSGVVWIATFCLFLVVFAPMLLRPRSWLWARNLLSRPMGATRIMSGWLWLVFPPQLFSRVTSPLS